MYKLTFDQLVKIQNLPDELRTGHWYNDLQHGMLVILLRRTILALNEGRVQLSDRLLDSLTMYLYVHFLDEEEGMAASLRRGLHHQDAIMSHLNCHEHFLVSWDETVLFPAKAGAPSATVIDGLVSYYNAILGHIAADDQETYGQASGMDTGHRATEIASIASADLPLSPYMRGAYAVVQAAAPKTAGILNKSGLPPAALEPLHRRFYAGSRAYQDPMLPGRRCVHDAVMRQARSISYSRPAVAA